jgi:2-iminobutanoate/2-iminopropanoate deaminase
MKQIVRTDKAPVPAGPYSQAVIAGGLVFLAGQIGTDPATDTIVEGGVEAQTHQVFANLKAVLEAAGTSLENVVKASVFLQNMSDFAAMNDVYRVYLGENSPARTTVEVARLPKNVLVEIDLIAVR